MSTGFPLPFLAGVLGYQVTGWMLGVTVFRSLNAEAMLFVFTLGFVGLCGWLCRRMDAARAEDEPYSGRVLWLTTMIVGAVVGVVIRLKSA